ncbi:MAG: TetR/AcrR family transcriptional regulator [Georgfuchsia sp.]
MCPARSNPPRQRRKEARPSELLAAALDLFVEKGFAATRLDDVAARAGVSKGTLYLYFDSKASLFKAVVENGMVPVLDQGADIVDNFAGSTSELLRQMLMTWWSRVGESKLSGICKLMVAEASNFPEIATYYHDTVIARGHSLIRRVLEIGIARGEFRPIDIETAVDTIFAPVLMLMLWRHSFAGCCGIDHEPQAHIAKHLDIVLGGLALTRR